MLTLHCKKNQLDLSKTVRRYLKTVSDEIHDVVLQLFNISELKTSGPLKLPLMKDPI